MLLLTPALSFASVEISDGSVKALYHLEDTVDSSGNGKNLTNNGSVTFTASKLSNGSNFGTSNNTKSLNIVDNLGIAGGSISMACWVNISTQPSLNAEFGLIAQGDTTNFVRNTFQYYDVGGVKNIRARRTRENVANDDVTYTQTLTTDTWYHLAYVYSGSLLSLYFNGSVVATGSVSGNGTGGITANYLDLGAENENLVGKMSGLSDECVVTNTALSTTTINALYNSGSGAEVCVVVGCGGGSGTSTTSTSNLLMSSSTDQVVGQVFSMLLYIFDLGIISLVAYVIYKATKKV